MSNYKKGDKVVIVKPINHGEKKEIGEVVELGNKGLDALGVFWWDENGYLIGDETHFKPYVENQEWNGEGDPPVGCECEYALDGFSWHKCNILYSVPGEGVVLKADHINEPMMFTYESYPGLSFRPLQTKTDKESDKAIKNLARLIDLGGGMALSNVEINLIANHLYDAGYHNGPKQGEVVSGRGIHEAWLSSGLSTIAEYLDKNFTITRKAK